MSSPKCKLEEEPEDNNAWKRVKRRHDPIKCDIELENGLIGKELVAKLVCEMCKYLLYDRQQIPFPLSNSKSLLQLNDKSIASKLTPKEELLLVMIEDLNRLFAELIGVIQLDAIQVESVCLSLGQTLQMPKELYCIEMPAMDVYNVKHVSKCKTISLRSAVTRFFKTILNDGNILFQSRKNISITKLFLLIKLSRNDVPFLMDHFVKDQTEEPLFTPLIDYELPKIGNRFKFTIKQKQCDCSLGHIQKDFTIYDENNDSNYIEEELTKNMSQLLSPNNSIKMFKKEEDFIWVQIKSSIKGIKYNNSNKDVLMTSC